jgi:hypothetical protein
MKIEIGKKVAVKMGAARCWGIVIGVGTDEHGEPSVVVKTQTVAGTIRVSPKDIRESVRGTD